MLENMICEDLDLSRFCDTTPGVFHELTDEELEEMEQRIEDWYLSVM